MLLNFSRPDISDCDTLSALVFNSKASHGYDQAFMEACRDEISVTPDTLKKGPSQLAWFDVRSEPLGFIQIVQTMPLACELEALFITPKAQGLGIGRSLFEWGTETASQLGYKEMFINSDPGAEQFYKRSGAIRVGEIPSGSIAGRLLPRLSYILGN